MAFDNIVYVYDKNMNRIAIFDSNTDGLSPEAMKNLMVGPRVHIEQNGPSIFSFQMLVNSEKWQQIKDPENIYVVNDRYYTALSESAYEYTSEEGVRVVNVSLFETWGLLDRQYKQAYNCEVHCYAKLVYTGEHYGNTFYFAMYPKNCFIPSGVISKKNAWRQAQFWNSGDPNFVDEKDLKKFRIQTQDEYKPTDWEDYPELLYFFGGSYTAPPNWDYNFENGFFLPYEDGYAQIISVSPVIKKQIRRNFEYSSNGRYTFPKDELLPTKIISVKINVTTITEDKDKRKTYLTEEKEVRFTDDKDWYDGYIKNVYIDNITNENSIINAVTITYEVPNMGNIKKGATCTIAYGAEPIDEHSFVILPKSDIIHVLTIDGIGYSDDEVRDQRGVLQPRGSAGYALWAALKGTGWKLGICDVIAKGFDTSKDYGCFNIETDMKDVLSIIQYIQELYGGILCWDSKNKVLNYRAENSIDYKSYGDDFNKWKGYEFRQGKNMTEQPVITVDNRIITKAYILGYGNLNIKAVNNGKSYIENYSYTNAVYEDYLKQELIYDTRDTGGQNQLLYWGRKELAKMCKPRKHIELSVTDIRTVEGYEHEVFDINDIVRVYYRDAENNEQVIDEKRIILWEYNVFAMWDCIVELGDKVQNLSEMFELVYNMAQNNPKPNGNGQISGGDINIGGDNIEGDTLIHYIELIARTQTENSDAIAGLILDTNNFYAQVDLFAYYQKQLDDLLTQAYAGLTFYADQKSAQAEISAKYHAEEKIKENNKVIRTEISDTRSELITYADKNTAILRAEVAGRFESFGEEINHTIVESLAGFRAQITKEFATAEQFSQFKKEVDGKIISETKASVRTFANEFFASVELSAESHNGYCKVTITSDSEFGPGMYVETDVSFRDYNPEQWNEAYSDAKYALNESFSALKESEKAHERLNGWTYGNSSFINGEMIATGTVMASSLQGGEIRLIDSGGYYVGSFYLTAASSADYAVEINSSAAFRLVNGDGDIYIGSSGNLTLKCNGGRNRGGGYYGYMVSCHGNFAPGSDGRYDLGFDGLSWGDIWSYSGFSLRSDKNYKEDISYKTSKYDEFFDKLKPASYKLKEGKSGRSHIGLIAQDVEQALNETGIDTKEFAGIMKYKLEDGKDSYSLRYHEFLPLCIDQIQKLKKRVEKLENELKSLD